MGDIDILIEKAKELSKKEKFEESLKILEDLYKKFPILKKSKKS